MLIFELKVLAVKCIAWGPSLLAAVEAQGTQLSKSTLNF